MISNEVYQKYADNPIIFQKEENGDKPDEIKASHILISYKGADRADSNTLEAKMKPRQKQNGSVN